jgi:uncharacterized membrane protein YccC
MLKFRRNMSLVDRIVRTVVGITLLLVGPLTNIVETDTMSNILLGTVGTIAIFSALTAYCFLYEISGFNTWRSDEGS